MRRFYKKPEIYLEATFLLATLPCFMFVVLDISCDFPDHTLACSQPFLVIVCDYFDAIP